MNTVEEQIALLASQLKARRKQLQITQTELADLAGVSLTFVVQLEKGKQTAALNKVFAVVAALGLVTKLEIANA